MNELIKSILEDNGTTVRGFLKGPFESYYILNHIIFGEGPNYHNIRALNNTLLVSDIKKEGISSLESLLKLVSELDLIYKHRTTVSYYLPQSCILRSFKEFNIEEYHLDSNDFFNIEKPSLRILNCFNDSDWEFLDRVCSWINLERKSTR